MSVVQNSNASFSVNINLGAYLPPVSLMMLSEGILRGDFSRFLIFDYVRNGAGFVLNGRVLLLEQEKISLSQWPFSSSQSAREFQMIERRILLLLPQSLQSPKEKNSSQKIVGQKNSLCSISDRIFNRALTGSVQPEKTTNSLQKIVEHNVVLTSRYIYLPNLPVERLVAEVHQSIHQLMKEVGLPAQPTDTKAYQQMRQDVRQLQIRFGRELLGKNFFELRLNLENIEKTLRVLARQIQQLGLSVESDFEKDVQVLQNKFIQLRTLIDELLSSRKRVEIKDLKKPASFQKKVAPSPKESLAPIIHHREIVDKSQRMDLLQQLFHRLQQQEGAQEKSLFFANKAIALAFRESFIPLSSQGFPLGLVVPFVMNERIEVRNKKKKWKLEDELEEGEESFDEDECDSLIHQYYA